MVFSGILLDDPVRGRRLLDEWTGIYECMTSEPTKNHREHQ